ncbi:EAL domain-containing protein [Xylophilus rhododendri]|uniref:EAL domain-containing protein n=1 Tax=Xylophilus rhododendri TaxID=2697032 RepID=A0A857J4I9_9BURK|nr:EAL domain-containing protein [Xylophilus rhododendri]QHI98874.1 EAL domain-containing protein [Xylophilus rhododendri]
MIDALRAQHLGIVFQPQYLLPGTTLCGFEALVRLNMADERSIAPEHFLPLAAHAGLMGALTLFMVETACRTLKAWRELGHPPVFISVNIECEDLADILFAPRVCRMLAEHQVHRGQLEFELVERRFLELCDTSRTNITQLRGAGVRLAMDDFGTGHSALSQLAELPFDVVKIDKSFLARIPQDAVACTLLARVVDLCRALHKQVVIEGVESVAQLDWIAALPLQGIRLQGNALSLPLPGAQAWAARPQHAARSE